MNFSKKFKEEENYPKKMKKDKNYSDKKLNKPLRGGKDKF